VSNTKQYDNYADLITFTRASTGTYLDSDGLLKTATTNTPRIEYDADGNRKGLLIEEARTNLYTNSGDMDGTGWAGFRTTYSAGDTSPDGSQLFLLGTASETNANASNIAQQTPSLSAGVYTMSVFAKAGPTDAGLLCLRPGDNVGFTDAVQAWFNLETGTVALANSSGGSSLITTPLASIQDFGDGVYRCSLTFTVTGAVICATRHYIVDGSGSLVCTIGKQVQLWGAQLEAGSFPTSYISTSGAAASRSADVASIPTSAFGYNADKGTVVVEAETSIYSGTVTSGFWGMSNGTTAEVVYQGVARANNNSRLQSRSNSTIDVDFYSGVSQPVGVNKMAAVMAANDFAMFLNGTAVGTDVSAVMPKVNTMKIGDHQFVGPLNGHIKSIQYYPRRLSNAQLQELTS
jgi:hypothetical protein